jgi:ribonuclease T2
LGIFALLVLAIPARGANPQGWTLALSWEPGVCQAQPNSEQCRTEANLTLVLHGLWPEGVDGCAPRRDGARRWCDLPPIDLSSATANTLRRTMPGVAACLDRHEWDVHGRCSGFSPDRYFQNAARMTAAANDLVVAKVLRDRRGGTVTMSDLRVALRQDFGNAGPRASHMICVRRAGEAHLAEIRFRLSADGPSSFPRPEALAPGEHERDRCPATRPFIVD